MKKKNTMRMKLSRNWNKILEAKHSHLFDVLQQFGGSNFLSRGESFNIHDSIKCKIYLYGILQFKNK